MHRQVILLMSTACLDVGLCVLLLVVDWRNGNVLQSVSTGKTAKQEFEEESKTLLPEGQGSAAGQINE